MSRQFDGLTLIDTLQEAGLSYEFHELAAWREPNGEVLWAEDSGCSCPLPFEDEFYNGESATSLNRSKVELRAAVDAFPCEPMERRAFLAACGLST